LSPEKPDFNASAVSGIVPVTRFENGQRIRQKSAGRQFVEKSKYATLVLFAGGVRERATETIKVIFQRVAEFISATRFLRSRRSGGINLPFIVEKAQRSGFFDSLKPGGMTPGLNILNIYKKREC
jgi:hypothetical protein